MGDQVAVVVRYRRKGSSGNAWGEGGVVVGGAQVLVEYMDNASWSACGRVGGGIYLDGG